MTGVAGDFARIYGSHLESPEHFLYMAYLTILGLIISDKIWLKSQRKPCPRLYTILLGESGNSRKSTAIEETETHFREYEKCLEKENALSFITCKGAASSEGIGNMLKKSSLKKVLLYYDELQVFTSKASIKNSTLLMAANTLFEATSYENITSQHPIRIEEAHMSLLSACTPDTYAKIFTSKFMDIGFNNRLFLVPGFSEKDFPITPEVPNNLKEYLFNQLNIRLKIANKLSGIGMEIDDNALTEWSRFYKTLKKKVPFSIRLDTYGLRLIPLLAINEAKTMVDKTIVDKIIKLLEWQLNTRRLHDPIDAEGKVAKMEETIRRSLLIKPNWSKRELQRKVQYNRYGIWVWDIATQNLKKNNEIKINTKLRTISRAC
jgi:hypothetical protein